MDGFNSSVPVAQMVQCAPWSFDTIDPPFAKLCFLPIQILYHNIKALIFNKNKGNNQKVETKVSGMVRVGVGRALLYQ